MLVCFFVFAREAAGASGARHSLRPRFVEGFDQASLGRNTRRGSVEMRPKPGSSDPFFSPFRDGALGV